MPSLLRVLGNRCDVQVLKAEPVASVDADFRKGLKHLAKPIDELAEALVLWTDRECGAVWCDDQHPANVVGEAPDRSSARRGRWRLPRPDLQLDLLHLFLCHVREQRLQPCLDWCDSIHVLQRRTNRITDVDNRFKQGRAVEPVPGWTV